jgi:lipopolysaccharide transport protein LptA
VKRILFLVCSLIVAGSTAGIGQQKASPSAAKASPSPAKSAPASNTKSGSENPAANLFGENKNAPKGPTEITARDDAQFDVQSRTAIFNGSVKVVDPQFTMTSDKLTVRLNREEEGGGLSDAEAQGNVYIVHLNQGNPGEQPTRSTGKSERALYDAKSGAITLLGWPQITQGVNTHIATEPGVKMLLYRDGRMKTYGSSRTVIQDRSEPNKREANAAP